MPSAARVTRQLQRELEVQGLTDAAPCLDRLRVFSTAFKQVIDMLPSYRSLLLAVYEEYERFIAKLTEEVSAVAPMEGRLKTMKVESLSFVSESIAGFQQEIKGFRKRTLVAEEKCSSLEKANSLLEAENAQLRASAEQEKSRADDAHFMNNDIARNCSRLQNQVDDERSQIYLCQAQLRKKEAELEAMNGKNRELEALQAQQENTSKGVGQDEYDKLVERLRQQEQKLPQLEEKLSSKQRDYERIVEAYSKLSGASASSRDISSMDMRPLTPRPTWTHGQGLLDLGESQSCEKAEHLQSTLLHIISRTRRLSCAYGCLVAYQKSPIMKTYSIAPLIPEGSGKADSAEGEGVTAEQSAVEGGDEDWFPPDEDSKTHPFLRHTEKVRNLWLSRERVSDLLLRLVKQRIASGEERRPFLDYFVGHIPEEYTSKGTAEAVQFALSVIAAVKRHSSEPDFVAYTLLLQDKLSDYAMIQNKDLCTNIRRSKSFRSAGEGSIMKKEDLWNVLQKVLPTKSKGMREDLQSYLPGGVPRTLVDCDALLLDDLHVMSPLVYGLRIQHLEETLDFFKLLDKTVTTAATGGTVTFEKINEALAADEIMRAIPAEEVAAAFGVSAGELRPETSQDAASFASALRRGNVFLPIKELELEPGEAEAGRRGKAP